MKYIVYESRPRADRGGSWGRLGHSAGTESPQPDSASWRSQHQPSHRHWPPKWTEGRH